MYSIQTPPPNDDDLRWADQQLGDTATPDLISDLAWRRSAERQQDLPLDRECAACGAEPRENCHVGCLGKAKRQDGVRLVGKIDLDDHPIVVWLRQDPDGSYVVDVDLGDEGDGTPAPPVEVCVDDYIAHSTRTHLRCVCCGSVLMLESGVLVDSTGGDVCGVRSADTNPGMNLPHLKATP